VGICTPGFADRQTGLLVDGGRNVPALRTASLPAYLAAAMGVPVRIENDGVAATLGEMRFGTGRGFSRLVLLTIGTGIGGAIAVNGSVITGDNGEPPELGAIVLEAGGARGRRTLEELAAGPAFGRAFEAFAPGVAAPDLPELFRRADTDDAARAAVDEVSGHIAHALGMLINGLNLESCLIGGGVAGAGEKLVGPIRRRLAEFTWPMLLERVQVLAASRGNDAGLLGAAWLAASGSPDGAFASTQGLALASDRLRG
jgi:glucokinase